MNSEEYDACAGGSQSGDDCEERKGVLEREFTYEAEAKKYGKILEEF